MPAVDTQIPLQVQPYQQSDPWDIIRQIQMIRMLQQANGQNRAGAGDLDGLLQLGLLGGQFSGIGGMNPWMMLGLMQRQRAVAGGGGGAAAAPVASSPSDYQ